jgi:hypothetical protein
MVCHRCKQPSWSPRLEGTRLIGEDLPQEGLRFEAASCWRRGPSAVCFGGQAQKATCLYRATFPGFCGNPTTQARVNHQSPEQRSGRTCPPARSLADRRPWQGRGAAVRQGRGAGTARPVGCSGHLPAVPSGPFHERWVRPGRCNASGRAAGTRTTVNHRMKPTRLPLSRCMPTRRKASFTRPRGMSAGRRHRVSAGGGTPPPVIPAAASTAGSTR